MGRVDLRLRLYSDLVQDRLKVLAEAATRFLRLPNIDYAESTRTLSGGVRQ
jgi:hypothetical protein